MADDPSFTSAPFPGPDEETLLRVGRGDRQAFEALYERFSRPLMTFLHAHVREHALAEDLLQETFLRAWRAAPRWTPRARASTWLFTIARNVALNAMQRRRRERLGAPALAGAARAGEASLPESSEGARLAQAITSLSEVRRTTLILVRLNGLSLADAADVLGVPVGTVKSRLAWAETELRARLADAPPKSPTGAPSRKGGA